MSLFTFSANAGCNYSIEPVIRFLNALEQQSYEGVRKITGRYGNYNLDGSYKIINWKFSGEFCNPNLCESAEEAYKVVDGCLMLGNDVADVTHASDLELRFNLKVNAVGKLLKIIKRSSDSSSILLQEKWYDGNRWIQTITFTSK